MLPDVVRISSPNVDTSASAQAMLELTDRKDFVSSSRSKAPALGAAVNPRAPAPPKEGMGVYTGGSVPSVLQSLDEDASIVDAIQALDATAKEAAEVAEVAGEAAALAAAEAKQIVGSTPPPAKRTYSPSQAPSTREVSRSVSVGFLVAVIAGVILSVMLAVIAGSAMARAARLRRCAERGGEACDRVDDIDRLEELNEGDAYLAGGRRLERPPPGHWAALR